MKRRAAAKAHRSFLSGANLSRSTRTFCSTLYHLQVELAGAVCQAVKRTNELIHRRLHHSIVQTLRRTAQRLGHCRDPRLLLADDVGGAHGGQVRATRELEKADGFE